MNFHVADKTFTPVRKTGRCANGAERDAGSILHLLNEQKPSHPNWDRALCGTVPGRLSAGWDIDVDNGPRICDRCLNKAVRLGR